MQYTHIKFKSTTLSLEKGQQVVSICCSLMQHFLIKLIILLIAGPNYIKYHLQTFCQIISVVAKLALSILIAFPSRINIHSQPYLHWIINFNLFVYFHSPTKTLHTERRTWWSGVVLTLAGVLELTFELIINIFKEKYSDI